MYDLIQQNKTLFRNPNPIHFAPSSPSSADVQLHFNYKLGDLQREIEKRTFYLGKFRKTEQAQHLLDLIGMSRDEGDLLYPFMKAAMADVYDNLNKHTLHITKRYEWDEAVNIKSFDTTATEVEQDQLTSKSISVTPDADRNSFVVKGTVTTGLGKNSDSIFGQGLDIVVAFNCETKILSNSGEVTRTRKNVKIQVPFDKSVCTSYSASSETWSIIPFEVKLDDVISSDSELFEKISKVSTTPSIISCSIVSKNPTVYNVGDIIKYNVNNLFRILVECDSNTLKVNDPTMAERMDVNEQFSDGINYYLNVPGYIELSSVEPLDNAILEALVNRVIWKWLILSYPDEAKTYDTLYNDAIDSLALRCNIFQKTWQRVPRVF